MRLDQCEELSGLMINKYTDKEYNILIYDEIPSTNNVLKDLAAQGAPDWTVVVAKSQTDGKGRLNRKFFSPSDTGLYFSVLLRRDLCSNTALMLTPAAAVGVAKAVEKYIDRPVKIKWVNDIYIDDKKVCGILSEALFDAESLKMKYAIIGIGINITEPKTGFPMEISSKAGYLFEEYNKPNNIKNLLIADVLNELSLSVSRLDSEYVYENYTSRSWLDGKCVIADTGNERFEGIVVGVDRAMRLLLRKTDGTVTSINSGEVDLKTL